MRFKLLALYKAIQIFYYIIKAYFRVIKLKKSYKVLSTTIFTNILIKR